MGVSGLTTYIYSKDDVYFEKFSLKDTPLVIDGNCLAAKIVVPISHMMTFGGDYDRIGCKIEHIFNSFKSCGIIPIVIFDGAVEKRKFKTVLTRLSNRVVLYKNVYPGRHCSQYFPLMLRIAMREKLINMGITVLQSDMEADREIAAVAKKLNAPVLSNDSDYFIYDVPYIPIDMTTFRKVNGGIQCKIFYPDKFLRISRIDKKVLPILSVVAGNDYIGSCCFVDFMKRLEKCNNSRMSVSQKNIFCILKWLKSETYESAVNKILSVFNKEKKKKIRKIIKKIVKSYTNFDTNLTDYIPEHIQQHIQETKKDEDQLISAISNLEITDYSENEDGCETLTEEEVEIENELECEESEVDETNSSEESEVDGTCDENDLQTDEEQTEVNETDSECEDENNLQTDEDVNSDDESFEDVFKQTIPNWVFKQSRVGNFHPALFTLINCKAFFSNPQIEDYSLPGTGIITAPLIKNIAHILLKDNEFGFWCRTHSSKYSRTTMKITGQDTKFKLESINQLTLFQKRNFFLQLYEIDDNNFLKSFPEEWLLFLFSLVFWSKAPNSSAAQYHIHSLLLMLITVETMEKKIGRYRTHLFMKKHKNRLVSEPKKVKIDTQTKISVKQALQKVIRNECFLMVEPLMPYFQADKSKRSSKLSSKNFTTPIVHSFSEFQNCLFATVMLNDVLGLPFETLKITKLYNSTFLYNMAVKLKSVNDYAAFISNFFNSKGSSSLTNLYISLVKNLENYLMEKTVFKTKNRRKKRNRRKAPKVILEANTCNNEDLNSDEIFIDPNNKFSTLLQF